MVTRNSSRCSLLRRAVDGYPLGIATIDERWGDPAKLEHLESFERDGMRTVKCFGSSKHLPHE